MAGFINETLEKQDTEKLAKKAQANITLRQSLSNLLNSDTYKKAYFFYGEEEYLIRYYKNALIKKIIGDNDLNLNVFEGPKFDRIEFMEVSRTLPFFADKRVVVLENTELFKIKKKITDKEKDNVDHGGIDDYEDNFNNALNEDLEEENTVALDDLFKDIPDTTVLIIVDKKIAKTLKVVKNLLKDGESYEINYQDPDFVKIWLTKWFKKSNIQITVPAMDMLVEQIGVDMNTLTCEADKLISYTNNGIVDVKDVEAMTSDRFENRVFKVVEFAVTGQMNKAIEAYKDVLALRAEPIAILVLMGKQISKYLAAIEVYNQTRNSWTVKEKTGVPFFNDVARFCNKENLEAALKKYMDLDRSIKEGNLDMRLAPELLIAYLAN